MFVVRSAEGRLNGFYNVCSHRGTKFLDDEDRGNRRKAFTCPYHAWTYDLDGRLIGTPNVRENELFDRSSYPLHRIAVDEYAGFVFVNLADRPRPLMDALTQGTESMTAFERFAMQDLRIGVRLVYEVEANWKIIVENYNECLHCPTVHPELVKVVPLFRFGEVWDDEMRDGGNDMAEGATSFTMEGRSELPTLPGLLEEDLGRYYGSYQFPNLMLNLHPDCVMYYIGYPKGSVAHHGRVGVPVPAGRDRRPRALQARAGRRALGPHLEAGLGGVPASPDRRRLARVHDGRLPATGPVPVLVQRGLSGPDGSRAARLIGSTCRIALGQQANGLAPHARQPFHLRRADVEGGLRVERTRLVHGREDVVGDDRHRAAAEPQIRVRTMRTLDSISAARMFWRRASSYTSRAHDWW